MEKMFMRVSEVTEPLDVSKSYAYKFFYESFTEHSLTKGGIKSASI